MQITQVTRERKKSILDPLRKISIAWRVTIGYLLLMLVLPILTLFSKASTVGWNTFWQDATTPIALSAYEVTFVTALVSALINSVFGTIIAWVLVRYEFPGRRIIDGIIDLPFALPTSVAGLTLATVYSPKGWVGSLLAPLGIKIAFTRWGVLIAMLFISLPFIVRTLQPVLLEMEKELEEAAWSLGASPSTTFWRVIFPPLLPAILTGATLGFSRAVGEYGSIVIIAANMPFKDLIASVLIAQKLENYDLAGATVIGTVLLLISLFLLLIINYLQIWGKRYQSKS
jgi:sulfate/thiosulfate transport system permease protein